MIQKVRLKQQLVFKVVIIAMCCAIPTFAAAQTNVADEILKDVRTGKISTAEGKRQCTFVIDNPANLPQKIEAVAVLAKLSHGDDPPDINEENKERRLNKYRQALDVALPILDGQDDAHRQSLPALALNFELAFMTFEMIHHVEDLQTVDGLTTRPLACLEAVLDADETLLIPPDKQLAEDEVLVLEKEWAKKELKRIQEQASHAIILRAKQRSDMGFFGERSSINRIVEKYPDNNIIQETGAQRLKEIEKILLLAALRDK